MKIVIDVGLVLHGDTSKSNVMHDHVHVIDAELTGIGVKIATGVKFV
jgi:hypothetical protein